MSDFTNEEKTQIFEDAPEWADSYGSLLDHGVFYNDTHHQLENGGDKIETDNPDLITFECSRPVVESDIEPLVYTKEMHEAGELPVEGVQFLDLGSNWPNAVRTCLFIDGNRAVYKVGTMSYECADITDCSPLIPPVELVNGLCYQYDYHGPKCGYYKESSSRLISIQGGINPKDVKNLTLLTPEGE
jgi:hypothetical protein